VAGGEESADFERAQTEVGATEHRLRPVLRICLGAARLVLFPADHLVQMGCSLFDVTMLDKGTSRQVMKVFAAQLWVHRMKEIAGSSQILSEGDSQNGLEHHCQQPSYPQR